MLEFEAVRAGADESKRRGCVVLCCVGWWNSSSATVLVLYSDLGSTSITGRWMSLRSEKHHPRQELPRVQGMPVGCPGGARRFSVL